MPFLIAAVAVVAFVIGRGIARARVPDELPTGAAVSAQSAFRSADVLDDHPTGVVIFGISDRVEYRNSALRRLAGTHSGVLLDEAIEHHLPTARANTGVVETVRFHGPPKLVFELSGRPLASGRVVVFVEDVSERHRIEHIRTDFVANVSHELKTPIGALSVLAETLIDEDDIVTVRRLAERMLAESERATRTVDDLIELSRIEAGGERLREPVRLGDIIADALDRVTEVAAAQSISVSTLDSLDESGRRADAAVVIGDRRQLTSAVGNLVENAVKYSEPNTSVQVRVKRNDPWFEISVTDQGVGIPQRDLDRVFERFYRVDRARSRTTGGTGLGLSIVRHVASSHDGDVVVTSVEGEGSTFVLKLPIPMPTAPSDDLA